MSWQFRTTEARCACCGGDHHAQPITSAVSTPTGESEPSPALDALAQAIRARRARLNETPEEREQRIVALLSAGRSEPAPRTITPNAASSGTVPAPPDLVAAIRAARLGE